MPRSTKILPTWNVEKERKRSLIRRRIKNIGLETYKVELRNDLMEAMDFVLSPKEKNLMLLYFNLDGGKSSFTYAKIAQMLHVTAPCVMQQIYTAIAKLARYHKWWNKHDSFELAVFNPRLRRYGQFPY